MPTLYAYTVGMRKPNSIQYTIRAVPAALDTALRRKAKKEGLSLNEVALDALRRGAGIELESPVSTDLDKYIGTWVEDPAFDAAIAEQDVVDPELWR